MSQSSITAVSRKSLSPAAEQFPLALLLSPSLTISCEKKLLKIGSAWSLKNLIVKGTNSLVEVHLLERGFEVSNHLPEVVEEGAELNEAEINSAAKSFGKEAVPKEESDADLRDWCIIGQLILANANKSSRTKRLRHFGSQKLSWLRLGLGLGKFSNLL